MTFTLTNSNYPRARGASMIPLQSYIELFINPVRSRRYAPKSESYLMAKEAKRKAEPRRLAMAFLYKQGKTLQEIGEAYGISRERVRQLIKPLGLSGSNSGRSLKSASERTDRKATLNSNRDRRTKLTYGCDYLTAIDSNEGKPLSDKKSAAYLYLIQRKNAIYHRDIGWEITFPEWIMIWKESGRWAERGKAKGKYCMGRIKDSGPYHPLNVYICPFEQNGADYQNELKVSGIRCADGFKRLPERIEKLLKIEEQAA